MQRKNQKQHRWLCRLLLSWDQAEKSSFHRYIHRVKADNGKRNGESRGKGKQKSVVLVKHQVWNWPANLRGGAAIPIFGKLVDTKYGNPLFLVPITWVPANRLIVTIKVSLQREGENYMYCIYPITVSNRSPEFYFCQEDLNEWRQPSPMCPRLILVYVFLSENGKNGANSWPPHEWATTMVPYLFRSGTFPSSPSNELLLRVPVFLKLCPLRHTILHVRFSIQR